jgi:type III restriction enzyme
VVLAVGGNFDAYADIPLLQTYVERKFTMNSKQKPSKRTQLSRKSGSAYEVIPEVDSPINPAILDTLSPLYRRAIDQAMKLYHFCENQESMNYASVFTPLLGAIDEAVKGFIMRRLQPELPTTVDAKKAWFEPDMNGVDCKSKQRYRELAKSLKRTLVSNNGLSLVGLLRSCLDYALNGTTKIDGVFTALRTQFRVKGGHKLLETIKRINNFRNTYIAHQKKELTDRNKAKQELNVWIEALQQLSREQPLSAAKVVRPKSVFS